MVGFQPSKSSKQSGNTIQQLFTLQHMIYFKKQQLITFITFDSIEDRKPSDITEDYYQAQLVVSALDLALQVILNFNQLKNK